MQMPADGGRKTLNLILKADGQGSVEALRSRVEGLSTAEVDIRVIYAGVGGDHAQRRQPRQRLERRADRLQHPARRDGQAPRRERASRSALLSGHLRRRERPQEGHGRHARAEVPRGHPRARRSPRGLQGLEGRHDRRLLRAVRQARCATRRCASCGTRRSCSNGELESLRRFKDDVREVAESFECGVQVAQFADLKQATSSRRIRPSSSRRSRFPRSRCRESGGGDVAVAGTPAISHPCEIATLRLSALAVPAPRKARKPRHSNVAAARLQPSFEAVKREAPVRPSLSEAGARSLTGVLSVLGPHGAVGRRDRGRALGSPLLSGERVGRFSGKGSGMEDVSEVRPWPAYGCLHVTPKGRCWA